MSAGVTEVGWPREFLKTTGDGLARPNLWIGGKNQLEGDWLTFEVDHKTQSESDYFCVVCGEIM